MACSASRSAAKTFSFECAMGMGSIPGRIHLQPIGSYGLAAVSSRPRSPLQNLQSCNGALGENQNEKKSGELSSLKMLIRQVVDTLQSCFLGVCQHHRPNGIAHMPKTIEDAKAQTVDWIGSWLQPLVERL